MLLLGKVVSHLAWLCHVFCRRIGVGRQPPRELIPVLAEQATPKRFVVLFLRMLSIERELLGEELKPSTLEPTRVTSVPAFRLLRTSLLGCGDLR